MRDSSRHVAVKICGMRDQSNLDQVCRCHPDMVGFIFFPQSPRYVYADGRREVLQTPEVVERVGVFVNQDVDGVVEESSRWELHAVQLHGDESPDYCRELRERMPDVQIMKVFRVREGFSCSTIEPYLSVVQRLLFDTDTEEYGGSGEVFSWEILTECPGDLPLILAGGLSAQTLPGLQAFLKGVPTVAERVLAFDLNSGVEAEPGVKDVEEVQRAVAIVRSR